MTRILGIDPGSEHTGVCLLEATEDDLTYEQGLEVHGGPEGVIAHLRLVGGIYKPDVTVVEGYEVRRGQAGDPHGLEVIGAVKFWLADNALLPAVIQPAAGRKQAVSDEALKRLGLYFSGKQNRNLKEAVRHAVWWAKKQKHLPTLRKGWPNV